MTDRLISAGIVILVVSSLMAGCDERDTSVRKSSMSDKALLSVFSELVPKNDTKFTYCLEVDGKDPSNNLVAMVLATNRRVSLASECTWVQDKSGSFHTISRSPAVLVDLRKFKQLSDSSAEIHYSSYHSGLDGAIGRCELIWVDNFWQISECVAGGAS